MIKDIKTLEDRSNVQECNSNVHKANQNGETSIRPKVQSQVKAKNSTSSQPKSVIKKVAKKQQNEASAQWSRTCSECKDWRNGWCGKSRTPCHKKTDEACPNFVEKGDESLSKAFARK